MFSSPPAMENARAGTTSATEARTASCSGGVNASPYSPLTICIARCLAVIRSRYSLTEAPMKTPVCRRSNGRVS